MFSCWDPGGSVIGFMKWGKKPNIVHSRKLTWNRENLSFWCWTFLGVPHFRVHASFVQTARCLTCIANWWRKECIALPDCGALFGDLKRIKKRGSEEVLEPFGIFGWFWRSHLISYFVDVFSESPTFLLRGLLQQGHRSFAEKTLKAILRQAQEASKKWAKHMVFLVWKGVWRGNWPHPKWWTVYVYAWFV